MKQSAGIQDFKATLCSVDWTETPLGPMSVWSERLKTMSDLVLRTGPAACLFWGPEGTMIYNETWARELGRLHPALLGCAASRISTGLGHAYRENLRLAEAGERPDLGPALMPVIWQSLVDRPYAALACTPVLDDRGIALGLLVQCTLAPTGELASAVNGTLPSRRQREGFLLRLSDELRRLDDPQEIRLAGTQMLGKELGADRASFTEIDLEAGEARVRYEYRREETAKPLAETTAIGDDSPALQLLKNGMPLILDDVFGEEDKPVDSFASEVLSLARVPFRAQLTLPILRAGTPVSAMTVRYDQPHFWSAEEIMTVQHAAVRTAEAVERAIAKARLRTSEARHRTLFDAVEEGVCLLEPLPTRPDGLRDFRYVTLNPALMALFGIPDLSGKSIREHFPNESEDWYDDLYRVIETGEATRIIRDSRALGKVLEVYYSRVLVDAVQMILCVVRDVTERVRTQKAFRESEAYFRALVNATSYAVYRMSPDWQEMRHLDGGGFLQDTKTPGADWLSRYIHPEDQPAVLAAIGEAIASKSVFQLEHRVKRPDGTLGWTFSRAVPIIDDNGDIVEWFGAASDVTARRNAEETVRRSALLLRLAQEVAGVGTFDWEIGTREARWSPELLDLLGIREGAFGGTFEDWMALIHPDDRAEATHCVEWALESGTLAGEWRVLRPDGEIMWVLVRGVVEHDAQKRPVRLTGAQVDITERINSEQKMCLLVDELGAEIEELRRRLRGSEH